MDQILLFCTDSNLWVRRSLFCQLCLQRGNLRIRNRPSGLPQDVAARIGKDDIRVISVRIIHEVLPLVIVIFNQYIMRLLFYGDLLAHAVKDHFNGKGRSAREIRDLIIKDMRALQVQRRQSLVPFLYLVIALAGKTNDEQQRPAACFMRKTHDRAIESGRLRCRDLLSERSTTEKRCEQ